MKLLVVLSLVVLTLNSVFAVRISSVFPFFSKSEQSELILGELNDDGVPLEFIDPLVYELMENPVTLPAQGEADAIIIDRWVLDKHFATAKEQIHPWTRNPINENDIVPNTELRDLIKRWKNRSENKKLAKQYKLRKTPPKRKRDPSSSEITFQNNLFDYIVAYIDSPPSSEMFKNIINHLTYIEYQIEHLDTNHNSKYSMFDDHVESVKFYYGMILSQSSNNLDTHLENLIDEFNSIRHQKIKYNLNLA